MGQRIIWDCDGCTRSKDMTRPHVGDWKEISVTVDGFKGYPVSDHLNGSYHLILCPDCQIAFAERAFPHRWPRSAEADGEKQ